MECVKCKIEMVRIERGKYIIYQCENCGNFNNDFECNNHKLEYVKVYHADGSAHIKRQCGNCGCVSNKLIQKHTVKEWPNIPELDEELNDNKERGAITLELSKSRQKVSREEGLNLFLQAHSKYLKTDEWRKKRELVLKRDKNLCQSCLDRNATEVHHLSYKFWRNEPLFDLISVCKPCHDLITKISREELEELNKLY